MPPVKAVLRLCALAAILPIFPATASTTAPAPADPAIFEAARIRDCSAREPPQRFAEGVVHVRVNGVPVLRNGVMAGAAPGEVIRR